MIGNAGLKNGVSSADRATAKREMMMPTQYKNMDEAEMNYSGSFGWKNYTVLAVGVAQLAGGVGMCFVQASWIAPIAQVTTTAGLGMIVGEGIAYEVHDGTICTSKSDAGRGNGASPS